MIKVEGIYKTFKLYEAPTHRIKEILFRRKYHREFTALNGVSFEVSSGETLGIIGQNGAGKSTLLKILTGVLLPDNGIIHIQGKITGLLELGTGFNVEFTGLDNIYLNGTLLGMSRKEIQSKLEEIVAFTELGAFINEPLKTYSSGMAVRLAFSIAIHADPQAFVVDEALSVGDAYFQQKCMKRIREFKEQGGSIIFVSHDMNAVKVLCDRALLLENGNIVEEGSPGQVINTYNFMLARRVNAQEIRLLDRCESPKAYGTFKVKITDVKMTDANGAELKAFVSGEKCIIEIHLSAAQEVEDVTVGMLVRDKFGQDIFGTNTCYLGKPIHLHSGECAVVKYVIDELNLGPGKYTLTVAAHREEAHFHECYEWVDGMHSFEIVGSNDFSFIGISRLKPYVQIERC